MIQRETLVGGTARVRAVLHELWNACEVAGLLEALEAVQEIPAAQRLGALLALDGQDVLASHVANWLRGRPMRVIPLESGQTMEASPNFDAAFKVWGSNSSCNARFFTSLMDLVPNDQLQPVRVKGTKQG